MCNRRLGNALAWIGSPASLSWAVVFGSIREGEINLLWSVPLAVITLPLLPIAFKSESILTACDEEDFHQKTKNLPHVWLPPHTAYIEVGENEDWLAQPFYYQDEAEPFETEKETKSFLVSKGYEEVVALDYPHSLTTYWIKKEQDCFLCKGLCNRDHD